MNDEQKRQLIDRITADWADKGKIVEGGWQAFLHVGMPPNAPDIQIRSMRNAFYMGAQHLFASILGILDPGSEPTEKDLRRMTLISEELEAFAKNITKP